MSGTRLTVAELVLLLMEKFNPLDVLEVDLVNKLVISPAESVSPGTTATSTAKLVKRNIFTVNQLNCLSQTVVDDLIYFDYTNPGNGPVERVGFVLKLESGRILLEDLSVGGKPRWFDHDYIEDIHLLS